MNSDFLVVLPYASVMLSNLNAQIIGKKEAFYQLKEST